VALTARPASLVAVAILLSTATPGNGAQTESFDLNCTLTHITAFDGGKMTQLLHKPIDISFRVNLATRRFCSAQCTETKPIYRVSPTEIVFEFDETPDHQGSERIEEVSRESGGYHSQDWIDGETSLVSLGKCQPAVFSGFPKPKF
jgi:hypothetical protein